MKIGAIGIRTKIIVGDAATWYLVKKYVDGKVGGGIEDVPEELKKYVRVLGSWVDVTEDLESIPNKVDKVDGKGLSTEDYTTAEKSKVANVPLNTNTELAAKVDKVEGKSLIADAEIDKLAEYPEFEDLEFSHAALTDKNSEAAFQHVDTTVTKDALSEADKVAILDSVTGKVILSNANSELYSFTPIGAQAFKNGSTTGISQLNRPILGNVTAVKRFNAATSAYDAPLVSVSNSSSDSIFIGNIGYTFTIRLKKGNIQIFQFTEASSIIFNNPSKITLFAEIDYDKLEIRISYSGYSRSIPVPELSQLKDAIFTNSQYCIYSYNQSKDWYLIRGLINHLNRNFVFLGTSDLDYIDSKFMFYKDVNLSTYINNSVKFINSQKFFIDGKVTFDRPTDGFPATNGGFPFSLNVDLGDTPIHGTQLIETFSFDVNAGYFTLECGTVTRVTLYRLTNKITGEVTDVRPNVDRNVRLTIPVGEYTLRLEYSIFSASWQYRSFLYECSPDFNITIYKDMEIVSGCCYQIAIPQHMTYNKLLCEAQNKIYAGIINPSSTY